MATKTNNPFVGFTPTSSDVAPTVFTDSFNCPDTDQPCSGPAGTYIADASNGLEEPGPDECMAA